jgi:hypothetical protein
LTWEINEKNLQNLLREKAQEATMLRNEIKHIEFMMMKPDDHLEDREKQILKERLEQLIRNLQ